ncbi:MAG TPA: ATP-dependent helicase, partial [Galbitalea sp.]
MPPFNKSAPKRAANTTAGDRKAGSKAAGHRGYRPADAAAAPKQRWTQSDRAKRAEGRPEHTDNRPNWNPREKPAYQPRGERSPYGDRPNRTERPAYGDRPQRSERPAYGDRPARTERPAY